MIAPHRTGLAVLGIIIIPFWTIAKEFNDSISAKRIPDDMTIFNNLQDDEPALRSIKMLYQSGEIDSARLKLCDYFKNRAAERYYFDWRAFPQRFAEYNRLYPKAYEQHQAQARYQMQHFPPETHWRLPFQDLTGKAVTAYELRHLARQYRAVDLALMFYYQQEAPAYLDYFLRQVADLNRAFVAGDYDDAGNAIYESFRGGLRVQNWLFCHHAYLASSLYDHQSQYLLIKTLLHHGAQLQKRTQRFAPGNHHTRGLVALFEIAICFREFNVSDQWLNQAVSGLVQHLETEVNDDGFQFERSIHYHKGDIENYFRVYQLSAINHFPLPEIFTKKLRQMFEALAYLAQPDRQLPVLQDDTDQPLAEFNRLDDIMMVGAVLFEDPLFKYFAGEKITPDRYWLFRPEQLNKSANLPVISPTFGSRALPTTGYYIMRNGWEPAACQMVISAGLSKVKPDHQHADMLGCVAYANGNQILPNYQVSYSSPDFQLFKNSWAKNVALVDNISQGQIWQPNEGGSGFGKWLDLPQPTCLTWYTAPQFDYFVGTHDKYCGIGVAYFREIIFLKDGFWLIRDHFLSSRPHSYQQVWQGDFNVSHQQEIKRQWADGSALSIRQLTATAYTYRTGQVGSKPHIVISVNQQKDFTYSTLLMPIDRQGSSGFFKYKWQTIASPLPNSGINGVQSDAQLVLHNDQTAFFFDCRRFKVKEVQLVSDSTFSLAWLTNQDGLKMVVMGSGACSVQLRGKLFHRETNQTYQDGLIELRPGDTLSLD